MSSTQAWECFRRAWRKSRVVRPFSRFNRSRSTSSPKRSSKDRLAVLGFWSCSSKAAMMPWSFRLLNVSRVRLLSIEFSFFSVVIAQPAHVAVRPGEREEPEAGAITLFGVRLVGELVGDDRLGVRADGAGPVDQAARAPLGVLLVRLGHVLRDRRVFADLVTAGVHGDATRIE